jgi:hypothetical protein
MAVPVDQITTLAQAIQYAQAGATDAAKVCPKAVSAYTGALAQIQALQSDESWYSDDEEAVAQAKAILRQANSACSAAKVQPHYTPAPASAGLTTKPGDFTIDPGTGQVKKAGFGWLGAALIAGAGYLLYKGSKPKRRRRKKRSRRRSVRRRRESLSYLGAESVPAPAAAPAAPAEQPVTVSAVSNPFVAGFASSVAVYAIARALGVDAKKAFRVAFVWGGTKVVYQLAMDMLKREADAVAAAAKAATAAAKVST